jgi:SAM-dependent methyltransferase
MGAFVILPPIFKYLNRTKKDRFLQPGKSRDRILGRYQNMESYPRLFARFKLLLDPMFAELPALLQSSRNYRSIIDIGCGYGVPACWLLERFPDATYFGIDPDPERVRIASIAVGPNGSVSPGAAPDMPKVKERVDAAMMIDMIHYLKDQDLDLTFKRLSENLHHGGYLYLRAAIPPQRHFPWVWWFENIKSKISGTGCYYRRVDEVKMALARAGFEIEHIASSGSKGELVWLIAKNGS